VSLFHTLGGPGFRCGDLSRSLSETILRFFFPLPVYGRCHYCLDILDPENEVPLKYFSTSVLCHGCQDTQPLEENFVDFFPPKKKRKKKKTGGNCEDTESGK
jgi:hypothetical protein